MFFASEAPYSGQKKSDEVLYHSEQVKILDAIPKSALGPFSFSAPRKHKAKLSCITPGSILRMTSSNQLLSSG